MAKLKRFFIILLVVVLLVGVAVGLYFYFTRESPPIVGDKLALTMNDSVIENNASLGLLDSGQAFTVESSEKYNVQVFAYCTQENDFTLTVGDEPYTWGDFDGRNVTAGFTFTKTDTGFTLKHYGLNDVISRIQNGITVKTDEFPPVDIFRMAVTTSTRSIDVYFYINAEVVGIEIDRNAITF